MSTCRPLFEKSYEIPLIAFGKPHLVRKASGFVSQSALPGFVWFFFKLNNFAEHLCKMEKSSKNALLWSCWPLKPKCCVRFLKLTLVMATPLWLPNFHLLQNNYSSTWAYGWALLGHFPFPWYLRHFSFEVRSSGHVWSSKAWCPAVISCFSRALIGAPRSLLFHSVI